MSSQAEKSKVSGKSVAAFLFMPQLWRSFEHFDYVLPILVRTLAVMFEQAGLIAKNHPGTMYGMAGMPKVRIRDLLGEAWVTLRTSPRTTPQQWGMFATVVMMFVCSIGSLAATAMSFFVSHAQAQIFNLGVPTDMGTVPGGAGSGLFDNSAPGKNGHTPDVALNMLDVMLRQAATGQGGALQRALGPLMELYNTAVMIIAALVVLWAVISIVVDTAATGRFGGGHNMVWTPIRFVFALGLLIPMGYGFSSGQVIIMKLAEWGSNLGTNGWRVYTNSVIADSLIIDPQMAHVVDDMAALGKIMTCKAAYNIYYEQTVKPDPLQDAQKVLRVDRSNATTTLQDTYLYEYTTGNQTALCGGVSFGDPDVGKNSLWHSASNVLNNAWGVLTGTDTATDAYTKAVRTAYRDAYLAIAEPAAQTLACDFNRLYFADGAWPNAECGVGGPSTGGGACGFYINKDTPLANADCIRDMADDYYAAVWGAVQTATAAIRASVNTSFVPAMQAAGWGAMGLWYFKISILNNVVQDMAKAGPVFSAPTPQQIIAAGQSTLGILDDKDDVPEHFVRVAEVLTGYERWWAVAAAKNGGGGDTGGGTIGTSGQAAAQSAGVDSLAKQILSGGMGGSLSTAAKAVKGLLSLVISSDGSGPFLFGIQSYGSDISPLAQLSRIGSDLLWLSFSFMGLGVLFGILAATPLFGMGIVGLLTSPVGALLTAVAGVLFASGAFLLYFIPLLPWTRVMFAVLSWIIYVFEAVIMLPMVALGHLTTKGDGLVGGMKNAYFSWLGILFRPILTVFGFVGGLMLTYAMVAFVNDTMTHAIYATSGGDLGVVAMLVYSVIYVTIIYTIVNSSFKLVDIIPSAITRWLGGIDAQHFGDQHSEAAMMSAVNVMSGATGNMGKAFADAMPGAKRDWGRIAEKFEKKPAGTTPGDKS